MTISTTDSRISYNGNGVTTIFSFPYRFLVNGDLVVLAVSALGVETTKTITTDYTVTGAGDDAGGSVTMLVAPASGTRLVIYRDTAITQETDYISGDPFPAESHERALDRLTMIAQEIGSAIDRTIKVPLGDSSSLNTTLPAAAARLDKLLAFDAATGYPKASTFTHTEVAAAIVAAYASGLPYVVQVNVNDYGAGSGMSATVNAAAIQNCIDLNPGKVITFPDSTYSFDTKIEVSTDGTRLHFPSCTLVFTGTGDAIHFYCTSTATTSTFVNSCGILGNLTVYRATSDTAGAGVRLTQCNLFTIDDLRVDNFIGGLLIEGGQLSKIKSFATFMSSAVYGTYVAGSYQIKFDVAPIDGGLYQSVFTTHFDKVMTGGSYRAEFGLWFASADGITFGGGYVSATKQSLALFKPSTSGKSVSGVSLGTVYLDAVNIATGTANCIEVLDDGFAGSSAVNNIDISGCPVIGNTPGKGLYSTHPLIQTFIVEPASFINCGGAEIDVASGDTTGDSWIGIPLPWTPVLTFVTPGNLSVSYTTQLGRLLRTRSGWTEVSWNVTTSAFTHTTASGKLQVTGLSVPSPSDITVTRVGSLLFNGITKASYTQFMPRVGAGSTAIEIQASGSAQALSDVVAADVPTGGTVVLFGSVSYPTSELG